MQRMKVELPEYLQVIQLAANLESLAVHFRCPAGSVEWRKVRAVERLIQPRRIVRLPV